MDFLSVNRMLRRRWWIIALPVALSIVAVAASYFDDSASDAVGYSAQIRYSAAQALNLPQREGDYQDVWLASEFTVNAFTDWVRSSSFRRELRAQLSDSDMDLGPLGIAADNARSIGVIYLSHADATALQEIATIAVLVLSQRNQEYFPQLGSESAHVTILEAPNVTRMPSPIADRAAPLIRIAVGIFVGLALAFAAEYFDQSIHSQEDLRSLGLLVIGRVPRN